MTHHHKAGTANSLIAARLFGTALALALLYPAPPAHADQTIILELPPSKAAQEAQAAERTHQKALEAAKHSAGRSGTAPRTGRTPTPSRHDTGTEHTIAQLGEVEVTATIRRTRSLDAAKLTTTEPGTYLAIKAEQGDWYGVLMADGSIGWIGRSAVRVLNYQVVATNAPIRPSQPDSLPPGEGTLPGDLPIQDIYRHGDRPFFTANPQMLLNEAYKYLGVPYVWGGNTSNGIDCSGFVKNVFESLGFSLPRLGSDQMAYGLSVPASQLQPGDRLYFTPRSDGLTVEHTGLYIGNGYFIHASSGKHKVAISSLSEPYYHKNFACARR